MDLQIGSTVGDYQVVGILGAGGMGKVYKVRNVISDRIEAMKVLLPDLANAPELADRFMREIKVQASLEHPNIAALHTALRVENQLLMLMEFVEGQTLDEYARKGRLPMAQAVDYIAQVLSALDYAHAQGVIHRDIKPANMMLTPAGVVKLMDFGIAKAATDQRLTMTGTTLGSLYYMSPEQIRGALDLDGRSDLYAVGVSLYELVTGKRPFDGDSQFAIMSAHLEQNPVPPVELDPSLPAALNDVILLSVAKDPGQRFQTAKAFRNALLSVVGVAPAAAPAAAAVAATGPGAAAPAPSALPTEPLPARSRGHRGLWMAMGAVAAVLAVAAVVQFGPWKKTSASMEGTAAPAAQPAATTPVPAAEPSSTPAPAVPADAATQPATPPPAQVSTPAAGQPAGQSFGAASQRQAPAGQPSRAVQQPAAPQVPARQTQPMQQPPQQPIQQQAPPQSQAPVAQQQVPPPQRQAVPDDSARQAQLQETREQLSLLSVRASTIRNSLQQLQRSQAAQGMNLRGDMQEAATLMNTYIDGAHSALNAGDLSSARNFMQKAERQVEKLEKFLGR